MKYHKNRASEGICLITDRHIVPCLKTRCRELVDQIEVLMIREKDWTFEEIQSFIQAMQVPSLARPRLILNWNLSFTPWDLELDGMHLGFDCAKNLLNRIEEGEIDAFKILETIKNKEWSLGISIHSETEWLDIRKLRPDNVILSNIALTSCKPGKPGIGVEKASEICRKICSDSPSTQVIGLGGLLLSDLEEMRALGFSGIALRTGLLLEEIESCF